MPGRRNMRAPLLAGDGPLAKVRPLVVFVVVVGLFAAGVAVGGAVGAILLGVLGVGVAILLAVTWKVLSPSDRVMRVAVLGLLAAVAIMQLR
ncbi:hypothetical protein [Actinocrispum wychmicini]|uniref:Uncharacterized protein n=1 Tax=Actinocrispum wychmicini TaxID=1213861 RepID=A0A4R2J1W3_9PSEU|nr:hypothetical protein [Actinocrispum wychmicini]TCO50866.1 hypothetical protein EV192_113247 [Actinocrispum wychmicini]